MMKAGWSRRQVLKGAGVALSLPWLETFAPRTARAQAAAAKKRYIALYQPNGTAQYWAPTGSGSGTGWTLSPLLQPLQDLKSNLLVFGNIANSAPYNGVTYTNGIGLGSHGALGATTWTAVRVNGPGNNNNGISVDQVIANLLAARPDKTYLPSLQVGLSTHDSSGDGLPYQHSRSLSWKSPTEPLYKVVNPQAVFDQLVAGRPAAPTGGGTTMTDPAAQRRRLLRKTPLDYILASAQTLQPRLSRSDKLRVDAFLSSVRDLETKVAGVSTALPGGGSCPPAPARPAAPIGVNMNPDGYNRNDHADVMIDLVAMAIECDITRVVSFMLDDSRSEFTYNFLNERTFTPTGSMPNPKGAPVGEYHALQHAGDRNNNITPGFATIGWWNSTKAAALAGKLAAVMEGGAGTLLDNTVLMYASGMHGGDHLNTTIPVAILGTGGKVLKQDVLTATGTEIQLADVHFTILQKVFGYTETSFGVGKAVVPDILA